MEAAGTITAHHVGGESVDGSLLVAGQQINANTICNTSVTIGGYTLEITEPVENITFTAKSLKQRCKDAASPLSE
ncbi:hypothetical protein D3C87_2015390 [compost metagenome]